MPTLTRGLLVLGSTLVITSSLHVVPLCLCLSLSVLFLCFLVSIFHRKSSSGLTSLWRKGGGGSAWGRDLWVWMYLGRIEFRYMFHFFYFTVCLALLSERAGWAECVTCVWAKLFELSYGFMHFLRPYKLPLAYELRHGWFFWVSRHAWLKHLKEFSPIPVTAESLCFGKLFVFKIEGLICLSFLVQWRSKFVHFSHNRGVAIKTNGKCRINSV